MPLLELWRSRGKSAATDAFTAGAGDAGIDWVADWLESEFNLVDYRVHSKRISLVLADPVVLKSH